MTDYVKKQLILHHHDIIINLEVNDVINRMLDSIERHSNVSTQRAILSDYLAIKEAMMVLINRYKLMKKEKEDISNGYNSLKSRSAELRDQMIAEIGSVLRESRRLAVYKEEIEELKLNLADALDEIESFKSKARPEIASSNLVEDVERSESPFKESSSSSSASSVIKGTKDPYNSSAQIVTTATVVAVPSDPSKSSIIVMKEPKHWSILHELEGELLLRAFSFLETIDVLSAAQVCKYVYAKVYKLFGLESDNIVASWRIKPGSAEATAAALEPQTNTPIRAVPVSRENSAANISPAPIVQGIMASNSVTGSVNMMNAFNLFSSAASIPSPSMSLASNNLSATNTVSQAAPQNFVESLSKKLTELELKTILNMNEKLRKQAQHIEALAAEKEDVLAKFQNAETVRDFLVDKVHNAELALKAYMIENNNLKKQAVADAEVVSYLDLRGQELEGQNVDLIRACEQMKATIDLQGKAYASMEEQLNRETKEFKERLEEIESNAKSQKKILAKEVRSLRSQVEELTRERNIYMSQLNTLRDALNISIGGTNAIKSLPSSSTIKATSKDMAQDDGRSVGRVSGIATSSNAASIPAQNGDSHSVRPSNTAKDTRDSTNDKSNPFSDNYVPTMMTAVEFSRGNPFA